MIASAGVSLLAVVVLVALMRLGVLGALMAWFCGQVTVLVVAARSLLPTVRLQFKLAPQLFRKSIWFGFRSNVTNLVGALNFRFDLFLVLIVLGASQAGRYAVVVTVLQLLFFIPNSIAIALRPVLASATHERVVDLTTRSIRLSLATSAIGTVVLGLFAPHILRVFGQPYISALPALLWSLPGVALYSTAFSTTVYWDSHARMPQVNLLIAALSLVLDVIGCLLLLPRLGLAGAGIAASIGYSVAIGVSLWIFIQHAGVTSPKELILKRDDFRYFSSLVGRGPDSIKVTEPS
jgi:O-antigen/teichoic acid export membrane protein